MNRNERPAALPRSVRPRLLAAALASCFAALAQANPTNPAVVSGSAAFSRAGNVLTVTNSNGAIINWNSFSIGANETTRFIQPSASSSVLNRVIGPDPSLIYGTLTSNGRVWLINTAGILVGAGARIDVAGFVASTLDVSDKDFLAGRLSFQAATGAGGVVVEKGAAITTPSGGSVYLVGTSVGNEGIITTPQGETILAAGQTVNLIDTGTPGVKVEITGAAGNVTNLGTIVAEAGQIGMAGVLVRNSGTLNASSAVSEGGRIFLRAAGDAYVEGNARISATGTKGGHVEVLGNRVAVVDQAAIDASGASGGGEILVGGDFQGKNPNVQNAAMTYFGKDATLKADATDKGDGGKVIVWADDTTRAYGTISARGGDKGGNGGFVETSGHRSLDFRAWVDRRAPMGRAGTLLLDPTDVTICTGGLCTENRYGSTFNNPPTSPPDYFYGGGQSSTLDWASITGQLALGNLTITTDGANVGSGDITFLAGTYSYNSANTLAFWANRNITFNSAVVTNGGSGAINLIAGWNGLYGGSQAATAGTGVVTVGTGSLLGTNGDIAIDMGNSLQVQTGATINAGGVLNIGTVATPTYGNIVVEGAIVSNGSSQTIATSGTLAINGSPSSNAVIDYTCTGTQTIWAAGIALAADTTGGSSHGAMITSAGSQDITTTSGSLALTGGGYTIGNIGHDNQAGITANGSQTFHLAGNLSLTGGGGGTGGYNNGAFIEAGRADAAAFQRFYFTNGGVVTLQGGSASGTGGYGPTGCGGACSPYTANSGAWIENWLGAGGQTLDFQAGSSNQINLTGGTGGGGNMASIDARASAQVISASGGAGARAAITLTGGASGGTAIAYGGSDYYMENSANIGSNAAQTIYAKSISMTGGSATYGGAFMGGGPSTNIAVTGALTMTATGSAPGNHLDSAGAALNEVFVHRAPVAIGNKDANVVNISAGSVSLSAGTANSADGGSPVLIGSLYGTSNVTIAASGGIGVSALANANGSNVMIGSRAMAGGSVVLSGGTGNVALDQAFVASGNGAADLVAVSTSGAVSQAANGKIAARTVAISAGSVTQPVNAAIVASLLSVNATGSLSFLGNNYVPTVAVSGTSNLAYNSLVPLSLALANTVSAVPTLNVTAAGALAVTKDGDLTLGNSSVLNAGAYGLTVDATGNLTISNVSAGLTGASISLVAGNTLAVTNSYVSTGGLMALKAPTINVTSSSVYGYDIGAWGNNLTIADNSYLQATHNVTAVVAGDIRVNNGSHVVAADDVFMTLNGPSSTVFVNDAANLAASTIEADSPLTVNLIFTGRSSGGVVIDGAETTTTLAGGSGFYTNGLPAAVGSGLIIQYAGANNPIAGQLISTLLASPTDNTLGNNDEEEKKKGDQTDQSGGNNDNGTSESSTPSCN